MRKRLIIGAITAVVIGVAAYVLSQPRKGTVEYHKRKYLAVPEPPQWVSKDAVPRMVRQFYRGRFSRQREFHRRALIDAGFLRESVFVVSNAWPSEVWSGASFDLLGVLPQDVWRFMSFQQHHTNAFTITAPREWVEKIGQAVLKADVPVAPREWIDKIGQASGQADVPETK